MSDLNSHPFSCHIPSFITEALEDSSESREDSLLAFCFYCVLKPELLTGSK